MLRKLYIKWLIKNHTAAFKLGYEAGVGKGMQMMKKRAANDRAIDLIEKLHNKSEGGSES